MSFTILLKSFIGTLFSFVVLIHTAQQPITIGETHSIYSSVLNEKRQLNIYLPLNFSKDSVYDVVYLLDGSQHEDFIHVVGLVQFLTMYYTLPKTIVVGIANVDRKRDFTFPTNDTAQKRAFPTTGGSVNFVQFIERELKPYINEQFKTSSTSYIVGQSLGGLLATEILIKKPELFSHYFITSPSLWWDNQSLLTAINDGTFSKVITSVYVHIGVGDEGKVMEKDAKKLASQLRKLKHPKLTVRFNYFPKEDHATILHNGLYTYFTTLYSKIIW